MARDPRPHLMELDPVAVALKFGFLAVLYLFLLWMARSAMKDLRRGAGSAPAAYADDATGMHVASAGLGGDGPGRAEAARGGRGGVARRFRLLSCGRRRAPSSTPTADSTTPPNVRRQTCRTVPTTCSRR